MVNSVGSKQFLLGKEQISECNDLIFLQVLYLYILHIIGLSL